MNTLPNYTLAARAETGRMLRAWAVLSRGTFSGAIFLTDIALIVAMSCLTGVAYHLAAYGDPGNFSSFVQVGVLAASIFAISNVFRGEYRLPNFFTFKPHGRRTIQLWNVTLICLLALGFLAQISVDYSRGWIVLFYSATLGALIVQRFAIVRVTALARAAGLISAQRIFLIGTGAQIGAFVHRYEPWMLGINIVGCRFITPMAAATPRGANGGATLDRDLARRSPASAARAGRDLPADAVVRRPKPSIAASRPSWRCRSRFISAPSRSWTNSRRWSFRGSARSPACSCARMPLSRLEIAGEAAVRPASVAAVALIALTPLLIVGRRAHQAGQSGPGVLRAAPLRLQPEAVPDHQVPHACARSTTAPSFARPAHDDPRVTRIGRWLRRWNVDEIPQLFNVIKGDMSLVGPRPHALSHDREYERRISIYARRHNVKPGITGWAQIHGCAARPTPTTRCASASSTTCSTSTIGRSGST